MELPRQEVAIVAEVAFLDATDELFNLSCKGNYEAFC